MFKDYYKILDIPFNSSTNDIKKAYRNQVLKWHPDKNPNVGTTEMIRAIIEANLILSDKEARSRYDVQYLKYYEKPDDNFTIEDSKLNNWMNNAKTQASTASKQVGQLLKESASEITSYIPKFIVSYLMMIIIASMVYVLSKSCNYQ